MLFGIQPTNLSPMKRSAKSSKPRASALRANPAPPDGLPIYRILTGPDDAAFCHRVSEALKLGYVLYGSPAVTFDGEHTIVAQAIIWPPAGD
jgi:hypothetical protein